MLLSRNCNMNFQYEFLNMKNTKIDGSAWSAGQNDLSQYIEIDLGRQFNISAIGTQGRQHTMEYVQEFKLESGIDGHDYNIYRDRNGNVKVRS